MDRPSNITVLPPASSDTYRKPEIINKLAWHRPLFASGFDCGWEPSSSPNTSLLSSPGIFSDVPVSFRNKPSNMSGHCLAAGRAYDCVTKHEELIVSTLTRCGWEGEYMIQVGFNEELLRLEQGTLQEIHIFFENDVDMFVRERLVAILEPFPIHFHTPSATHCVPEFPLKENSFWESWARHGIYRAINQPAMDNDTQSWTGGGSHSFPSAKSSSEGGSDGARSGREREGSNSGSDDSESGDGDDNGNSNFSKILGKRVQKPTHRGLSVPFSSTLTCEGDDMALGLHPSMRFKTHACIDIKMESNITSNAHPSNSKWSGPWLEAKMTLLDAGIQEDASLGTLGYSLGLSQVRFVTSSCPSSILHFSPTTVCAEDDGIITKSEKTRKGGIQATLSANPSVRLEGTFGSSSGEETVQKRWEILPHCFGNDRNEITGDLQTTMMWKYVHNDKCYQRKAGNVFNSRPSAIFGLSRLARKMPVFEIEVIMHYSCASTPSRAFSGGWLWTGGNQVPAYMNFLHQTSVLVDLEKTEGNSWVVGLGANDRQEPDQLGAPFPLVVEQAESDTVRESACNVSLGRALYGCIGLSAEERKNARPLLSNITLPSSPAGSLQGSPPSSATTSPLPSPSSSPPSSSKAGRGGAEYITRIPAGYVVNGRQFKDKSSALRMANMFKNMANIRHSP
ncbi:hypothetical protein BDZ94DRAFT_1265083 [Collybia nuda]|uniref:Uncharacterized protein n=1 Tax=Collybia nuda TaxID=64659 RepID=A0A9P5Y1E0_9AGAR|nr:hypothetical protein BDZ94DRAFT_1265083 [Collybia nuda]